MGRTGLLLAGFAALLGSTPFPAAAQGQIGSAVAIVNLVTADYNRDTRSLQRGDRVHQNETIEVGLDASSEFKLDDDTKLALGPGSLLTLDKFVYNPDKTGSSIVLDLIKGTFRFMTGVADKPTYSIKTPAASITVRGTIFDVFIQQDGTTWVLLHEGAVQVRSTQGQCKELYEPGKLIRVDSSGAVGAPVRWASLPGKEAAPFNDAFPFVAKTPSIDPEPSLTRKAILDGALPGGTRPSGSACEDVKPDPDQPDPPQPTKKAKQDYQEKPKKQAKPIYEEKPKKQAKKPVYEEKPKKQAKVTKKPKSDYEENIMDGMDVVIGLGAGIGKMKGGKYKGGGGGGMPGGGGYPSRGGGGGGYGGGMMPR